MKLHKVAQRFNNTPCNDAYTGEFVFYGQFDVYPEAVRDGISTQRRVLELAPHTQIPPRRTVSYEDTVWIIGERNIDVFRGKVIREKFPVQKSNGLATVKTMKEVAEGLAGFQAHAGAVFSRTAKQVEESSGEFVQMTMYFANVETIRPSNIIEQSGRYYIVREQYQATAGHLGVLTEELEQPFIEEVESSGEYDPITETYKPGGVIRIVRLRWQTDFQYFSQMTPTFERGDMQVVTSVQSEVEVGSVLDLSDGPWKVVRVDLRNEVKYLHLRRDA